MALKGVNVNGTIYRFDHDFLDNKPESLPPVTISDEGKFLRVDGSGKWSASAIPSAEEASF